MTGGRVLLVVVAMVGLLVTGLGPWPVLPRISDEVVDLFLPVRFYWVRRARWLKIHKAAKTRATSQQELVGVEYAP